MRYFISSMVFLLPLAVCAQEKKDPKPGDEMIQKYLNAETDKLSQKFLDGAKTLEEWQKKRPRLYQEYMDMLGLWPIPEKTPLKVVKTGEIEAHGVVVENIHFQSKPGLYVTANVYRPRALNDKRLPAIVYVCGHSNRGRDGNKTAFQDHGFWFANNGYVCIVLDTLQLGEIPAVHHGTYGRPWISIKKYEGDGRKLPEDEVENRFWWHSIGYSPAAVECWNGMRAIDYLCTRPDVDPDKIGVTGISGGGAATFWIAAADERVKVAVPVSGMADLESYVKNKVINGHCDCMFLYNTYQWDWTTIAALVAPRPLLFANSDKDPIFPMDANRRVINKLYKVYDLYGMDHNIDECVSAGGHDYRPDLRISIFDFFNKRLKGDKTSKVEDSAKYTPLDGRKLRVFPEDTDLPKDAINARVDETFIPIAKVVLPEKGKFAEWKKELIAKLLSQAFQSFPKEIPAIKHSSGSGDISVYLETEKDIIVGMHKGPGGIADKVTETAFVVWGRSYEGANEVRKHIPSAVAYNFSPRGAIVPTWTTKSPPNYVARSHLLLGRTVDEGRLYDVRSWLRKYARDVGKNDPPVKLYGHGDAGILAAYAALFEPSIKEVIVIDPPKSHKEGPHFLNVLRVLDIPEALGLLAPTPLTIIGGQDKAFDRTAEIYRLAGAAEKLTRK